MIRRRRRPTLSDAMAVPLIVGGAAVAAADIGRRVYRHTQIF